LPPRSNEKGAHVGSFQKIRSQCFQTLEKEVQNETGIATGLMAFSAALLLISTCP
jgi:hypothetical protein